MKFPTHHILVGALLLSNIAYAKEKMELPPTKFPVAMSAKEKSNVAVVFAFMNALNIEKSAAKVAPYIDDRLITHNPQIDGKKGMVGFADYLKDKHPNAMVVEWTHVYAKGDMVVQHYLYSHDGIKTDTKIVDFFRVRDGRIVEYWDVLQELK
jgi:predicted SnoaL-like aldol condensation-catalyzing enzyme